MGAGLGPVNRLATQGLRVASRDVQKVYASDGHSMIGIVGARQRALGFS